MQVSQKIFNMISPFSNDTGLPAQHYEFFRQLSQWENNAHPDENGDRSVAAERIRTAYETSAINLDLQNLRINSLPNLPDTVENLNLNGCVRLVKMGKISNHAVANRISQTVASYSAPVGGLINAVLGYFLRSIFFPPHALHASNRACPNEHELTIHHLQLYGPFVPYSTSCGFSLGEYEYDATLSLTGAIIGFIVSAVFNRDIGHVFGHVMARIPLPLFQEQAAVPNLPEHLPRNLRSLSLQGIPFEAITVPNRINQLDVSHCALLRRVSALADPLQRLDVTGCTSLWALPARRPAALQIVGFIPAEYRPSHEQWYQKAGRTHQQLVELNQHWQHLRNEQGFDQFQTLLGRLGEGPLSEIIHANQVTDIIDEVVQSPATRPLLFAAAFEAAQDCHDRVLLIFDNIRALAKASALQRMGASEKEILDLAKGMVKQALLDEAVPRVMTQQWMDNRRHGNGVTDETGAIANNGRGTGPNMGEALEVQLALRHQLGHTLDLPFLVNQMLYESYAHLSKKDKILATDYVNAEMGNQMGVIDRLVTQPVWVHYVTQRFAEEVQSIKVSYTQTMEDFETANDKGFIKLSESDYVGQVNQLALDLTDDILQLLKDKTYEIIAAQK